MSQSRKEELLARVGIAITATMFLLGAAAVLVSDHSPWVVGVLTAVGVTLLWFSMAANSKIVRVIGRWFPLG